MVMGYGNSADVLQETINILDDYDIDFFIHWDKKYKIPNLYSRKSKIMFVDRISVNWGTDTQIKVENKLMTSVLDSKNNYDYVHLISSNDMPLMDVVHFKNFFKAGTYYVGYLDYLENYAVKNIKYYYPIRFFNVRNILWKKFIIKIIRFINQIFQVDRIGDSTVEKGCNWFSMDIKFVRRVIKYKDINRFMNTYTGDEFYVQTILKDLKPVNLSKRYNYYSDDYRMTKSSKMAARYIDWYRDRPYIFLTSDFEELKDKLNTKYAFARKIYNPEIIKKVFNKK